MVVSGTSSVCAPSASTKRVAVVVNVVIAEVSGFSSLAKPLWRMKKCGARSSSKASGSSGFAFEKA